MSYDFSLNQNQTNLNRMIASLMKKKTIKSSVPWKNLNWAKFLGGWTNQTDFGYFKYSTDWIPKPSNWWWIIKLLNKWSRKICKGIQLECHNEITSNVTRGLRLFSDFSSVCDSIRIWHKPDRMS